MTPTLKLARAAAIAAALALAPSFAAANSALTALGIGSTFTAFATDETVGWTFTANGDLKVTRLGWFVTAPSLNADHRVGLWDSTGALLGSATILAPGPALSDGFRYVAAPFAPFTLTAGKTYFIGGRDLLGDGDSYITGLSLVITDPAITFKGSARSPDGSGFAFPSITTAGGRGRFGPNFLFDVAPKVTAGVPEPATWGMMILGFGLAGATLRRRRQDAAAITV